MKSFFVCAALWCALWLGCEVRAQQQEKTFEQYLADLSSDHWYVREPALARLKEIARYHVVELSKAMSAMADEDTAWRLETVLRFLPWQDEKFRETLLQADNAKSVLPVAHYGLLVENTEVRAAMAQVVGQLGQTESIKLLQKLLEKDDHTVVRRSVTIALGKIGGTDSIRIIESMLQESDPSIVIAALKSLDEMGASQVLPSVIELLGDTDGGIRGQANQFLLKYLSASHESLLLGAIRGAADATIVQFLLTYTGSLKLKGAHKTVLGCLMSWEEKEVKQQAVWALKQVHDSTHIDAYVEAYQKADFVVRAFILDLVETLDETKAKQLRENEDMVVETELDDLIKKLDDAAEAESAGAQLLKYGEKAYQKIEMYINKKIMEDTELSKLAAWRARAILAQRSEYEKALVALCRMNFQAKNFKTRWVAKNLNNQNITNWINEWNPLQNVLGPDGKPGSFPTRIDPNSNVYSQPMKSNEQDLAYMLQKLESNGQVNVALFVDSLATVSQISLLLEGDGVVLGNFKRGNDGVKDKYRQQTVEMKRLLLDPMPEVRMAALVFYAHGAEPQDDLEGMTASAHVTVLKQRIKEGEDQASLAAINGLEKLTCLFKSKEAANVLLELAQGDEGVNRNLALGALRRAFSQLTWSSKADWASEIEKLK